MSSVQHLLRGFDLIFQPGIRWLALTPIAINLTLYSLMIWWLFGQFGVALDWAMAKIPTWLGFLASIAWIVFSLGILLVFGYSFSILAAIIASPFNGLLAEKVAEKAGNRHYPALFNGMDSKVGAIATLVKRSLWRELVKLGYFFPRILLALAAGIIFGFIPLIGLVVSALVFLWAAWSMCIQYVDYPADNDGVDFNSTIGRMRKKRTQSLAFGSIVTLLMGVPLLNLFAMPAAVAGATLFWLEQFSEKPNNFEDQSSRL